MPPTITELVDSRERSADTLIKTFIIDGTDDDAEASSVLWDAVPAGSTHPVDAVAWVYDGKPTWTPEGIDELTGAGRWRVTCTFARPQRVVFTPLEIGQVRIRYSTGGGRQHITRSIATTRYPAGAPDHGGAIGVRIEGAHATVEGLDIQVPQFEWTVSAVFAKHSLPAAQDLNFLTGAVNAAAFSITDTEKDETITVAAFSTKLLNAESGYCRPDGGVEYTFHLATGQNVTGLTIGTISGIAKGAHDYLEVMYKTDDESNEVIKVPKGVYVHQVAPSGDFTLLGVLD